MTSACGNRLVFQEDIHSICNLAKGNYTVLSQKMGPTPVFVTMLAIKLNK
jgi:hypothetical protein